jgi:hypothetical protein
LLIFSADRDLLMELLVGRVQVKMSVWRVESYQPLQDCTSVHLSKLRAFLAKALNIGHYFYLNKLCS